MCLSIYNRLWDRARYLWENPHFILHPLHSAPPLGGFLSECRHPIGMKKTRMVSLPDGEKISKMCLFVLTWSTNASDGQTDTAWQQRPRLCIASRGKTIRLLWNFVHSSRFWTGWTSRNQKMKKLHWSHSRVRQNVFLVFVKNYLGLWYVSPCAPWIRPLDSQYRNVRWFYHIKH